MRKLIPAGILWAIYAHALAQQPTFNRVYDINTNNNLLYAVNNIEANAHKRTVSLSYGYNPGAVLLPLHYFMLTKHDIFSNSIVYNRIVVPTTSNYVTQTKDLLETPDNGVLTAGFYVEAGQAYPVLVKTDHNGNVSWSKTYLTNFTPLYIEDSKITITQVYDDPDYYFIVINSTSTVRWEDDVINVIKVDASGNLVWSRKYYDYNLDPGYARVRDIPSDIAFSAPDGMYMITGRRQLWSDATSYEEQMFFMGIDRDGNIMTPFKYLESEHIVTGGEIVYDPTTSRFVAVYSILDPSVSALASHINLVGITPALSVNTDKIYTGVNTETNLGLSVSLSTDKDYYIIGCNMHFIQPGDVWNQGLLKIKSNGAVQLFNVYDHDSEAYYGHHVTIKMLDSNGDEIDGYALMGSYKGTDLRLVQADMNLEACDAVPVPVNENDIFRTEGILSYYTEVESPVVKTVGLRSINRDPVYYDCLDTKSYLMEDGAGDMVSFVPGGFELNNLSGEEVRVELYALSGQQVYSAPSVEPGAVKPILYGNLGLPTGLYLLRLHSDSGWSRTVKMVLP